MKAVIFDMDGVLVDFNREMREKGKVTDEEKDEYVDNTDGLFAWLKPMDGAIESFEWLSKHFECYILTTAPWKNISALSDKRRWIEKYLPEVGKKKLIITHNKGLNKGKYLIDDRIAKGVEDFEGEHIYFGKGSFKKWKSVLEYISKKENKNLK